MDNNVRYNISPCSSDEVSDFIGKIDMGVFVPNGTVKANDRSHYDRYSFLCNDNRVAVVYDTSASIISITGRQDYANNLLNLFAPDGQKTVKRSTVPAQNTKPVVKPHNNEVTLKSPISVNGTDGTRAKLFVPPERIRRRPTVQAPTIIATYKGAELSTDEIYPPQVAKKRNYDSAPPRDSGDRFGGYSAGPGSIGSSGAKVGNGGYGGNGGYEPPLRSDGVGYGSSSAYGRSQSGGYDKYEAEPVREKRTDAGISISANTVRKPDGVRRAVISFGDEEDDASMNKSVRSGATGGTGVFLDVVMRGNGGETLKANDQDLVDNATFRGGDSEQPIKRKRGRPPKAKPESKVQSVHNSAAAQAPAPQLSVRRRGRPPKTARAQNDFVGLGDEMYADKPTAPEYKNGYSVKNCPAEALSNMLKSLKSAGKTVTADSTEFAGTDREVKSYTVSDSDGQKVILRYATKKMTLQLQGKRSELFGEVQVQVSSQSDYSSALEGYVDNGGEGGSGKTTVSDVQTKLKKRLPTAFEYLSEQSRIDFSYGIHDFAQNDLRLSDYSVLLVPAFRGLERLVFDLQRAEGIKVKMIGQAFDKDDSGRYILKTGYSQRIGSVVYPEVMVALYSEYFYQRNFFAHSDNTDNNVSRSIHDRTTAKRIFDRLLAVIEYNAKKLKEIGFTMERGVRK